MKKSAPKKTRLKKHDSRRDKSRNKEHNNPAPLLEENHPRSLLETKWGPNDRRLCQSKLQERNSLDCVKSRKTTVSPVEDAVQSDLVCMISDVAIRVKPKLPWDPQKAMCLNGDAANRMLRRPMRSP